jgi:hypothetical protein
METAREAAASKVAAGSSCGGVPAPAGEYWSEALKSFLDHIPISSIPGALQPTASPGKPCANYWLGTHFASRRRDHSRTLSSSWFCCVYAAVEIKLEGSVLDAIGAMYGGNAAGAVIVDEVQSSFGKYVDRDIGFVEFSSIVLWALEVT